MSNPHFLSLEDHLHERLRASLDSANMGHVRIYSAPSLHSLPEKTLPTPSVVVMYDDYSVDNSKRSDGKLSIIKQTWIMCVCTHSSSDIRSGEASRAAAGDIADVVLRALMGWAPASAGIHAPLTLTSSPRASYEDGFFYLPIAVEAELIRKST